MMYKTIRHGENSLQYTILPQHDDFKGIDGKGRSARGGRKKRSLMAFIGLFFVCSIITGAILVPLMVSVEFMASPSAWFQHRPIQIGGSINATKQATMALLKSERAKSSKIIRINSGTGNIQQSTTTTTTMITYPQTDPVTRTPPPAPPPTEPAMNTTPIPASSPSTTTTTSTTQKPKPSTMEALAIARPTPEFVIETVKPTSLEMVITSSIVITEKSATLYAGRKPIVSIEPDDQQSKKSIGSGDMANKDQAPPKNWLKSHWPIVDPSTYFQWTDYESEDNILLPAIFCLAIVGLVIFASLCVVVKNKKCCSRKRKEFLTVEAQNGDNTTLLTNEFPSDEE